jgi:hypothetical protein
MEYYMKRIIPVWALYLILLITGCTEPYIDSDKIYTVTFFPNGGSVSVTSMETDVKGRLASLPSAARDDDNNPDTGELRSYAFTGWFTTGGTQVSLKTVFQADTLLVARWKASDEKPTDQIGPLADWLAFLRDVDPLPTSLPFSVNANENLKPQILSFGGRSVAITLLGISNPDTPVLSLSGFGALFTVESGVTLTLKNIRLEGKRNNSSMIVVKTGGKLIIENGTVISGNGNENKDYGGGVTVNTGAVFEMTGGQIVRNSSVDPTEALFESPAGGGGVLVRGGIFTMKGGQIGENEGANGGGVLVARGGTFTMDGGEIYKNGAYQGGGVKAAGAVINTQDPNLLPTESKFIMNGGKIYENTGTGAGVAVGFRGVFTMNNGEITKNIGSDAGGVYNGLGTVYMYDGKISDNRGPWSAGGVMNQGQFYMFGGEISNNFGGLGGGVTNFVPSVMGLGGFFHMWDGKISGNIGDGSGGGVVNDAFFYMYGGEISGNRANVGQGGGVYNGNSAYEEDGLFVITGGVIYGRDMPPDFHDPDNWDKYANIDNGGGSRGGAFYLLGGTVAWGRRGYYELDEDDNIVFIADTRFEDGKLNLFADVAIGIPTFDQLVSETDEDGNPTKYVTNIRMSESIAKQDTSNKTIEVKTDGVYIHGKREVVFADLNHISKP